MNHRLFVTALTAGALSLSSVMIAQAAGPQAPAAAAPAPAAAAPAVKPEAIPAKIALIAFEQAVFATNEGQAAVAGVQKKYEPQRAKIEALGQEVDSLKKQLQAATTLSDEDRATRVRTIDTKEKQLNREGEDASTAYQQELQEAYGKVATKVADVMRQYVAQNGYTLLLDVSGQQSPVMWAAQQTDITRAVIDAYNTKSGVAAPPPPAPRPAAQHSTTPHKAAPKK